MKQRLETQAQTLTPAYPKYAFLYQILIIKQEYKEREFSI